MRDAIAAAVGCTLLQLPYAVNGDPEETGTVGKVLTTAVPIEGNGDSPESCRRASQADNFDGYSNHWWWDNICHLLAGYAVGRTLATKLDSCRGVLLAFLAITTGWEYFEYVSGERPWHTNSDGEYEWCRDHRMEDTILDTFCGLCGAWIAAIVADC